MIDHQMIIDRNMMTICCICKENFRFSASGKKSIFRSALSALSYEKGVPSPSFSFPLKQTHTQQIDFGVLLDWFWYSRASVFGATVAPGKLPTRTLNPV